MRSSQIELVNAIKRDRFSFGDHYQRAVETELVGNKSVLMPDRFYSSSYITTQDHILLGVGLLAGIQVFRKIDESVSS